MICLIEITQAHMFIFQTDSSFQVLHWIHITDSLVTHPKNQPGSQVTGGLEIPGFCEKHRANPSSLEGPTILRAYAIAYSINRS